jgi:predicted ATPase
MNASTSGFVCWLRADEPRFRASKRCATIDWSYQLLDTSERTLLAHLSVFAGGWTVQGGEHACGTGLLRSDDVHLAFWCDWWRSLSRGCRYG